MSPGSRAAQTVLYAFAPFFAYPWKPLLNDVLGGDYAASYKHFRAQHMDGTNLALHMLCLVWQLSSNYAFLRELDRHVEEHTGFKRFFSNMTSLLWSWHLCRTSPTPVHVKLLSVGCIAAGHFVLGRLFEENWRKVIMVQGAFEGLAIQTLALNKPGFGKQAFAWLVVRSLVWKLVSQNEGCLKGYSRHITLVVMAIAAKAASSDDPLKATIAPWALTGWLWALLTGNKGLYFWASGMMATISQGVAHAFAGEAGTLVVLQDASIDMTSYEFSHVTFFPNLLLQAVSAHAAGAAQ
jgi:hypothetical protein